MSEFATSFDATEFWPSSLVQQFPSRPSGGVFPQIEFDQYATLSRGYNSNQNRNWSLQPNVSLNRGNHNIRSGLDLRWTNVHNNNYNNAGGLVQFNRDFTRSTLGSTAALEGNAFASFLLGAPSGGAVDINPVAHYKWFFAAPWIQDDWRVNNRLTVNLGFRWDINGSVTEADNQLNYAFDPTIVNPVSARLSQQVRGASGSSAWTARRIGPGSSTRTTGRAAWAWPTRSTRRPCSAPGTASTSSTRPVRATMPGSSPPRI